MSKQNNGPKLFDGYLKDLSSQVSSKMKEDLDLLLSETTKSSLLTTNVAMTMMLNSHAELIHSQQLKIQELEQRINNLTKD